MAQRAVQHEGEVRKTKKDAALSTKVLVAALLFVVLPILVMLAHLTESLEIRRPAGPIQKARLRLQQIFDPFVLQRLPKQVSDEKPMFGLTQSI